MGVYLRSKISGRMIPKADDILKKHAGDCLTVNGIGSRQFTEAMKEYARQVLDHAAEVAKTKLHIPIEEGCRMITDAYDVVDKQSILKIKDEL
jgi:hypothetical protein